MAPYFLFFFFSSNKCIFCVCQLQNINRFFHSALTMAGKHTIPTTIVIAIVHMSQIRFKRSLFLIILELTSTIYAVVRRGGIKQLMSATIQSTLSRPTLRDSRALHERSVLVVGTIPSISAATARMVRSNVTNRTTTRGCRRYATMGRRWITTRSA